jgi:ribosomal protein S18 acetylase RimI-like enzyme
MSNVISYKINTATYIDIYNHLFLCNNQFIPPLNEKVILEEYALKLQKLSITFEAWNETKLIGLIASYFNDSNQSNGFISNVSVLTDFSKTGIASKLLELCKKYALKNNFRSITLNVDCKNISAHNLYLKNGFKIINSMNNFNILVYNLNV